MEEEEGEVHHSHRWVLQSGTSFAEVSLLALLTASTENHPDLLVVQDETAGVEVKGERKDEAEVEAVVFAAHVAVTAVVHVPAGVV